MTKFEQYTKDTAPEGSKKLLADIEKNYGFVPNIFAHMSESPLPVRIYTFAQDLANKEATLSAEEINIVQLATSVENACEFCVPAHSTIGRHKIKTDGAVIDAIRDGKQGPNAKLNALVNFTQSVTVKRGHVENAEIEAFLKAGYTKAQIFEVISIVAYKVITNYTSAIAGTKPNEQFAAEGWSASGKSKKAA